MVHTQDCGYWWPGAQAPVHQYPHSWPNIQKILYICHEQQLNLDIKWPSSLRVNKVNMKRLCLFSIQHICNISNEIHNFVMLYFCCYISHTLWFKFVIKSPQYTGGDFMFLYCHRPQILVHAITFEQFFGFLSFLPGLLALTYRLPD